MTKSTKSLLRSAPVLLAAIILTSACTLSLSVQKQNNNSNQGTEQTTSVDSLSINPVLKK